MMVSPSNSKWRNYSFVSPFISVMFSVYVVIWYLEIGKRYSLLGSMRVEFIVGLFLTVFAVYMCSVSNEPVGDKLGVYIVFYFLLLLIQLPLAYSILISWDVFFNRILKFACMALFITAFVKSPDAMRLFFAMFFLAWLKLGQEAFLGKITGSMIWENQGVMRLHGIQGTLFGHPNSLSANALSTLPFVFYLYPILGRPWKIVFALQCIFAGNIILFTGSRTGYVGFFALLLMIFIRSSHKLRVAGILLLGLMLSFPLVPAEYKERFSSTFYGREKEGNSKAERLELLHDSIGVFLDNPLGVGMGGFRLVRQQEMNKSPMDTHNLYTEILSEIGVFGFIGFAAFLVRMLLNLKYYEDCYRNNVERLREALDRESIALDWRSRAISHLYDLKMMQAVCSSLILYIGIRLIVGLFGHDLYEMYWWLAAGLTMAIGNIYRTADLRTKSILIAQGGQIVVSEN